MNGVDSFFVDTNVLLYRFSAIPDEKQRAAGRWLSILWEQSSGRLSWQVVNEFYSNAVGKLRIPPRIARETVNDLMRWKPEPPIHATIHRAWHWCDTAQVNFWDALIVAAAEQSGCRWLLSEDFQAGRKFGNLTVVNPFQRAPAEFGLS